MKHESPVIVGGVVFIVPPDQLRELGKKARKAEFTTGDVRAFMALYGTDVTTLLRATLSDFIQKKVGQ